MPTDFPCGECMHYDPILGPGEKETKRGWCIKRSLYPAVEGPGQMFPPNVSRVTVGKLAKPYIVKKLNTITACELSRKTDLDSYVEKKKSQQVTDAKGRRVLS